MKITITFKNGNTGESYDIAMDSRQRIETTLRVMRENLPGSMEGIGDRPQLRSDRTGRRLSEQSIYEESHIYTGDILLVSGEKDKK